MSWVCQHFSVSTATATSFLLSTWMSKCPRHNVMMTWHAYRDRSSYWTKKLQKDHDLIHSLLDLQYARQSYNYSIVWCLSPSTACLTQSSACFLSFWVAYDNTDGFVQMNDIALGKTRMKSSLLSRLNRTWEDGAKSKEKQTASNEIFFHVFSIPSPHSSFCLSNCSSSADSIILQTLKYWRTTIPHSFFRRSSDVVEQSRHDFRTYLLAAWKKDHKSSKVAPLGWKAEISFKACIIAISICLLLTSLASLCNNLFPADIREVDKGSIL